MAEGAKDISPFVGLETDQKNGLCRSFPSRSDVKHCETASIYVDLHLFQVTERRSSLTKQISIIVAKTQTGGYKLDVDPLMWLLLRASKQLVVRPLVICSGVILAACAGMVNAIAFETAETLVSHVTGTVSKARKF